MDKPLVTVVSAAIVKEDRILIQQRLPHQKGAGLWEIPGGKVDQGEMPEDALRREILEELGTTVTIVQPIGFSIHNFMDCPVLVLVYAVEPVEEPRGAEGQTLRWVSLKELYRMPDRLPQMDKIAYGLHGWVYGII